MKISQEIDENGRELIVFENEKGIWTMDIRDYEMANLEGYNVISYAEREIEAKYLALNKKDLAKGF